MATHSRSSCLESPMDRGAWRATVHGSQRVGCNRAQHGSPDKLGRGLNQGSDGEAREKETDLKRRQNLVDDGICKRGASYIHTGSSSADGVRYPFLSVHVKIKPRTRL